jgi:hypothetical protein
LSRFNVQASIDDKTIAAAKMDTVLQNLKTKTPGEVEDYFRNNLSAMVFLSDAEIDAQIDGVNSIAKVQTVLRMLAKDNAFQARMQLLEMKLLLLLARKLEVI